VVGKSASPGAIQRIEKYKADNIAAAQLILTPEKLAELGESHGLTIWARAVIRRQTEDPLRNGRCL